MKNTTRRRKEKKLLELMKRATDQCFDGIIITDSKLDSAKIIYTNNEFCSITRYRSDELVGKSLTILHGPKTNPQFLARRRTSLAAGHSFKGRTVKYRKDGSEFYSESDSAPVFNQEGKITNFIYIIRDISKQVSAEEDKEEIVSVVGHEIKTPLTAIKGFIEILKKRMQEKSYSKTNEYLSIINSEVDRLVKLSNELLGTTQIQTIGILPNKQESDMDDVIRQVIKNIKIAYSSHRIRRRGKIGEVVNCDKDRIRQVITNLLTNAIKYSPNAKDVFVKISKENNNAIISIQDFGIGIAIDKQQKIFERYYRATNTNHTSSSGLGLYISAEIIKNHDGKIWVESTEGQGSIFSFSLPLSEPLEPIKNHKTTFQMNYLEQF
jgi:PAS domain S-box-containing protein